MDEHKSRYETETLESYQYLVKELYFLQNTNKKRKESIVLRTVIDVELFEDHISYVQLPESLL